MNKKTKVSSLLLEEHYENFTNYYKKLASNEKSKILKDMEGYDKGKLLKKFSILLICRGVCNQYKICSDSNNIIDGNY